MDCTPKLEPVDFSAHADSRVEEIPNGDRDGFERI